MATFTFDGTRNVLAAKADTVVITANPALFLSAADNDSGGAVFTYAGGTTLTIDGTRLGPNSSFLPNVSLANGDFSVAAAAGSTFTGTKPNELVFVPGDRTASATVDVSGSDVAGGVKAVFGGSGIADPFDGPDRIVVGGKGSFLVYGNGGDDSITQGGAAGSASLALAVGPDTSSPAVPFDSTSFVTVFGGKGNDSITLDAAANSGAHMAIFGGEGSDTVSVVNTGSGSATTIFGGAGGADPNDGADSISFSGGGVVTIYANAGDDTVNFGNGGLDSTGNLTVHAGLGDDRIDGSVVVGAKAILAVYGDEGADTILLTLGGGTNAVYGDTAAADPKGGADSIFVSTAGTSTIYAAGGNDTINLYGPSPGQAASTDNVRVFGGNGADSVLIGSTTPYTSAGSGSISITLGAGSDTVNVVFGNVKGTTYSIEDYAPAPGGDRLVMSGVGAQAQATVVTTTFQTLQQALDAAAQGVTPGTRVAAIVFNGATYVVGNDTTAGFSAATDVAIKLTGVTDLASVATSVTGAA